jgi:flagellin-specific chaperone FliS
LAENAKKKVKNKNTKTKLLKNLFEGWAGVMKRRGTHK